MCIPEVNVDFKIKASSSKNNNWKFFKKWLFRGGG